MKADPKQIAASRAQVRQDTLIEFREAAALEQIADTLEALRAEFVGFQHEILKAIRKPQR